jgi:hypothetical protein
MEKLKVRFANYQVVHAYKALLLLREQTPNKPMITKQNNNLRFRTIVFMAIVLSLYACEISTDAVPNRQESLSGKELQAKVAGMPEYQKIIELIPRYHEQISSTIDNLSPEQKTRLTSLYSHYSSATEFMEGATSNEMEFFGEILQTVVSKDLHKNQSFLLEHLSAYRIDYAELSTIILRDIHLKDAAQGRAMDMSCAEVYQQIYWAQVDYWFTFMQQTQSVMSAEEIDMRASTAAQWAYVGCKMGGGE